MKKQKEKIIKSKGFQIGSAWDFVGFNKDEAKAAEEKYNKSK